MKIELKQIVDQLTEAMGLSNGQKVSALIDDDEQLVGWAIVNVQEDGTINPASEKRFDSIKELITRLLPVNKNQLQCQNKCCII